MTRKISFRCTIEHRVVCILMLAARRITLGQVHTIIDESGSMKVKKTIQLNRTDFFLLTEGYAPFLSLANRGDVFLNADNPGPGHYDIRNSQTATIKVSIFLPLKGNHSPTIMK